MAQRENRVGVFEMPQDPELADLFRIALRSLQLQMRTHSVGTLVTYNANTQRANVSVDILQIIKDNSKAPTNADSNPTTTQAPVQLKDIPVHWPGTNSAYQTFPLLPGAKGELHVQDRSIQGWLELGIATDPVSAFTHTLADAVFHPSPLVTPITPPTDLTAAVLEGPLVKVGRLAVDFPIKGTALAAALAPLIVTLTAVPAATDPATVVTLANANKAALLAFMNLISPNLATKAMVE
jgi:hypothetical protein